VFLHGNAFAKACLSFRKLSEMVQHGTAKI
jgi:hypothetical protein